MPASPRETLLCRYHYDPLDRQADCTPYEQAGIQRFYCKSRLASEIQGAVQRSIFQHDDQLLAQQQHQSGNLDTTLLATDQQRSVLNALDATRPNPLAYTPYGHCPPENGLLSLLGFNGERPDPVTGHYHLGNGYRQFNPVLMRFNSPDSWSPFGKGGLNAYTYCEGNPVLGSDSTGRFKVITSLWKGVKNRLGLRTPGKAKPHPPNPQPNTPKRGNQRTNLENSHYQTNHDQKKTGTLISASHPEDKAGSAEHKRWVNSQERNRVKIQQIESIDMLNKEPHSSKHYWPKSPRTSTPEPEPSFKEFLSSATYDELFDAHMELFNATKQAAFPRELKTMTAIHNEIIRRFP